MKDFIRLIKQLIISVVVFVLFALILLAGMSNILNPVFQMLTDPIAELIRIPGDALRDFAISIPMWLAKGFFLIYYVAVLAWVWLMKKEYTVQTLPGRKKPFDVRPIATASMVGLIIITLVL